MGNTSQSRGDLIDMILGIVVIVALIFLFKYIWHGATWAFNEYVDMLHVN